MKVKLPIDLSNIEITDPLFISYLSQLMNSVITILNGEISFSDNFKARIIPVIFNTANLQQAVNHGLNKIPIGYLNIGSKASTSVYSGSQPTTPQTIYLQATVATTVNLLIF